MWSRRRPASRSRAKAARTSRSRTPLIGMAQDGLAVVRAGLRRRACRHPACRLRLHPEGRRRHTVGTQLAARRDRRLGLSAPFYASDRAVEAHRDARAAAGYRRRRLLAAKPGPNCASDRRLYGAIAPEAIEAVGPMGEDRRDVGLLAVTSADRLNAGWTAAQRARERGLVHARSPSSGCWRGAGHCGIVTVLDATSRNTSGGSARSTATASAGSASSISARLVRFRISTATTALTRMQLSPRRGS